MLVGILFAGRFRIERLIGAGGMGEVYEATQTALGRRVALKVLLPEYAQNEEIVRRFAREARASAAIRHPNVVEVIDVLSDETGQPAIVMELLTGRAVSNLLEERGTLELAEACRVLAAVASGVAAAHVRGVVHRDLKPDNIFLAEVGAEVVPKVVDFGIAKVINPLTDDADGSNTRTGAILGTPYYMAPEQAFGEKSVDHRADVWSLGVVAYELLSGKRPFEGDNPGQILRQLANPRPTPLTELRPDLPQEIYSLIVRMMEPDLARRVPDLTEPFAIFSKYAGANVAPIPSAPASLPRAQTVSVDSLDAHAPTFIAQPAQARTDASATTDATPTQPARRRPAVIGALALTAILALGFGWLAIRSKTSTTDTASAGPIATAQTTALASSAPPPPVNPLPELTTTASVVASVATAPKVVPTIKPTKQKDAGAASPVNTRGGGLIEAVP